MRTIAYIGFVILGIAQFVAIYNGFEQWLGLHWIITLPLAFILGQLPLVGTVVGMFGAVEAWGWSWLQSFLLFFGPFLLLSILYAISGKK